MLHAIYRSEGGRKRRGREGRKGGGERERDEGDGDENTERAAERGGPSEKKRTRRAVNQAATRHSPSPEAPPISLTSADLPAYHPRASVYKCARVITRYMQKAHRRLPSRFGPSTRPQSGVDGIAANDFSRGKHVIRERERRSLTRSPSRRRERRDVFLRRGGPELVAFAFPFFSPIGNESVNGVTR